MTDVPPIRSPKFQFVTRLKRVQRRDWIWVGIERNSRWLIIPHKFSNVRHSSQHCLVHDRSLVCRMHESVGYHNQLVLLGRDGSGDDWLCHRKEDRTGGWALMRRGGGSAGVPVSLPDDILAGATSGTGLERVLAAALVVIGLRFDSTSELFGRPDFVVPERRIAIFAHGCHHHAHRCGYGRGYGHRLSEEEIADVRRYDLKVASSLNELGWRVITVWECSLGGDSGPVSRDFLDRLSDALANSARLVEISGARNIEP